MATQPPSGAWEENIDLRKLAGNLLNNWKIILASVVLFAAISVVFGFLIQPTVYESSGGIFIPADTLENEFGFTQQGYLEFSSSNEVMELVRERLDIEQAPGQLRNQFSFTLESNGLIAVSATGQSAKEAFLLADAWIDSYQQAITSQIDATFNQSKTEAARRVDSLWPSVAIAEEALERFNLEYPASTSEATLSQLGTQLIERENRLGELRASTPQSSAYSLALLQRPLGQESGATGGGGVLEAISPREAPPSALIPTDDELFRASPFYWNLSLNLRMSQLVDLQDDLVVSENRLRELKFSAIPTSETRVASLRDALSVESKFLEQFGNEALVSEPPVLNPVYVALSRDLATSGVQLDVERREVEALQDKIADLKIQLSEIGRDLLNSFEGAPTETQFAAQIEESQTLEVEISALQAKVREVREGVLVEQANRRELESEARSLRAQYNLARTEQDRLFGMEVNRESLPQLTTIREPAIPNKPISPQRGRNVILSIFVGLVAGVTVSLVLDYYRGKNWPRPTTSN